MKRIRALGAPPPGLSAFVAEAAGAADWNGFRDHRGSESYKEIADDLMNLQHRLCGYCEIEIGDFSRQVEHVVPRSHPRLGAARALDAANMIASCLGGAGHVERGARRRRSASEQLSCGQKKGNYYASTFVDPRKLPSLPSLLLVHPDGRIEADEAACRKAARSRSDVTETVRILGLNVERLRMMREDVWRTLDDQWSGYSDDRDTMREAARAALTPREGRLPPFFTTSRSFFAEWGGEDVLAEAPQDWI